MGSDPAGRSMADATAFILTMPWYHHDRSKANERL